MMSAMIATPTTADAAKKSRLCVRSVIRPIHSIATKSEGTGEYGYDE
jgi:hypothetical protein